MNHLLLSTLAKALFPLIAVSLMLFVARRRGLSFANDLGLKSPSLTRAAWALGLWLLLVAVEELVNWRLGGPQPSPWPAYPAVIIVLRIFAIGVAGPLAEELVFRGLLLGLFQRGRLGPPGAIVLSAVLERISHAIRTGGSCLDIH